MTKTTNNELLTALTQSHDRLLILQGEKEALFAQTCEQKTELALAAEKIKQLEEKCRILEETIKMVKNEKNALAEILKQKRLNANEASKRSHAKRRAEKSVAVPETPAKTQRKKKSMPTP